jgi:hypothetical protein
MTWSRLVLVTSTLMIRKMTMASVDPALKSQWEREPDKRRDLIVKTQGQPRVDWLAAHNIQIRQEYRLTSMIAVTCTGVAALDLARQNWVISIEPDAAVSAF